MKDTEINLSRIEENLRESDERYRILFESNPMPSFVFDVGTLQFLDVNSAAVEHYGYSLEEFFSMTVKDIRPPEDTADFLKRISQIKDGIAMVSLPTRHRKKDGTIIYVEITSRAFGYVGKRVELVIIKDITERKRAEEEREQLISKLQEALAKVKTLSGFLPICASCKNIRNDQGYWEQIEVYIRDHSDAELSHSICPGCMKKLYPRIHDKLYPNEEDR
ncbi:MAG: PAS domain-containing protein [Pyrinomonadaceae bacterium]